MTRVIYEVIEHDGGWAYRVGSVFSETFATHKDALDAATRAAQEQQLGGITEGISFQDDGGRRHNELSRGDDRPETEVVDADPPQRT